MKTALILGITGQDGSYLAEFLLKIGYEVHGLVRRSSSFNTSRIDFLSESDLGDRLVLHHGDISDSSSLTSIIQKLQPDEIYNLAAQSHVRLSFDLPILTSEVTGLGTLQCLEAIRHHSPRSKFYQASSSEMFGATPPPQDETTSFHPRSPYGVSKVYSYWMTKNYREAYGLHVTNGVLFNHESPRRTPTFVTRKITRAVARIEAGLDSTLSLGNLAAKRDWGYAPDYVVGMWLMVQQSEPDDFVLATGTSTSVKEWLDGAFAKAGIEPEGKVLLEDRLLRPSEVDDLVGDATKAEKVLGWKPQVMPGQLLEIMLQHDRILISDPGAVDRVVSPLWSEIIG